MRTSKLSFFVFIFFALASAQAIADFQEGRSAFLEGDYATAHKELRPLAEKGHAEASVTLGVMYEEGLGVTQSYSAAFEWFKLAAEGGNNIAHAKMGIYYIQDLAVGRDVIKAYMWLSIAESGGSKIATKGLALLEDKLNTNQKNQAQELARDCIEKGYKNC